MLYKGKWCFREEERWAGEILWWVKALAAKADLSLVSRTGRKLSGRKNFQPALPPDSIHSEACVQAGMLRQAHAGTKTKHEMEF